MKYLHKFISLSFLCLAISFQACNPELDVAPEATYNGKANCTIEELLAYHDIVSSDSYDSIPANIVITGIVTSSDEHGNCYKYINIEDGTGGIQIKIDNKALYHKYPVGQRVYVECDGLVIGDYRKLPQMGIWANGKIEAIPANKVSSYIYVESLPVSVEPIELTSVPTSAEDLLNTNFNRLVRLKGASFPDGGNATFSESNSPTSRDINLEGGGKLILRTSNYADFAGQTLPKGTGTIVGLLTRYNNDIQLVIRDLNDLQNFIAPQSLETIYQVDFSTNPFENGWSQNVSENSWNMLTNNYFSGFYISANETSTDSWLVSPVIALGNASSPTLTFNHRTPNGGNNKTMKCYFTTDYTGDVNTTSWTEIPIEEFSIGMVGFSYELPAAAQNNNFRFAFRYNGSNSSWYIKDIAVSAIVN